MAVRDKTQAEIRIDLKNAYANHGLILLLGAGASVRSGLPNWRELAKRILTHDHVYKQEPGSRKFQRLLDADYRLETVIGMAEDKVLRDHSQDRAEAQRSFTSIVRECLYSGFEYWDNDISHANARQYCLFIETTNQTLRSIYDLAVVWDTDGKISSRNINIHAIINFNLDALLSAYDKARHILAGSSSEDNQRLRTIERPTAGGRPDKTSVYHPHGYLRFDTKRDNPEKEAPDLRILTEYEYYDFYNRPTAMYTYTVLHVLREHQCLFIGSSMTDENIRRLLHYSRDEEKKSFERERPDFPGFAANKRRHFALLRRSTELDIDSLVENSLAGLGVNAVWINGFEEIPQLLEDLRK